MSLIQLHMVWPEGREIPNAVLSEGYTLRPYQDGDLDAYLALMHAAGFSHFTSDTVKEFRAKALPDGVFVAVGDGKERVVATAMAVHRPQDLHPMGGELGWVAGDASHAGKGLGAVVCAAVVERFLSAGYERIYLQTDDNRLAAMKVYLKLGFVPFLCNEDNERRWREICAGLEWPFTFEEWAKTDGPVVATSSKPRTKN